MECVGFRTRLCKPRHPFTKGKVERLIRFVKGNFLAGRGFTDITALNEEALLWCAEQAGRWRRAVACVPSDEHASACVPATRPLEVTAVWETYLGEARRFVRENRGALLRAVRKGWLSPRVACGLVAKAWLPQAWLAARGVRRWVRSFR